jgi:hypothetical protein
LEAVGLDNWFTLLLQLPTEGVYFRDNPAAGLTGEKVGAGQPDIDEFGVAADQAMGDRHSGPPQLADGQYRRVDCQQGTAAPNMAGIPGAADNRQFRLKS